MKTSKFFLSTLVAAAAMTSSAYAISVSGTADGSAAINIGSTQVQFTENESEDESYYYYVPGGYNNSYTIDALNISEGIVVVVGQDGGFATTIGNQLLGSGTLRIYRGNAGTAAHTTVTVSEALTNFSGTLDFYKALGENNYAVHFNASAASATVNVGQLVRLGIGADISIAGLTGTATNSYVLSRANAGVGDTYNDTTVRTLTLSGEGTYSYAGIIGSATNQSSLNLTKTGTGTQTLSGTTYLGNLKVSGGVLNLNGATSLSIDKTISVADGATLNFGATVGIVLADDFSLAEVLGFKDVDETTSDSGNGYKYGTINVWEGSVTGTENASVYHNGAFQTLTDGSFEATDNSTYYVNTGTVNYSDISSNTSLSKVVIEKDATLSGGQVVISGKSLSVVGAGNMTLSGTGNDDGKLDLTNGGNVTIGESEQTGPTVSLKQIRVHNANTSTTETLTINSGTVTVTSEDSAASTSSGVLLGHWPSGTGKLVLNGGTVNAEKAFTVVSWNSAGVLEINGGVYNTRGIALSAPGDNQNKAATLSLAGGRLNVGTGGITFRSGGVAKTFNFSGGTLGTLTETNWSSDQAITLSGTTATIDTSVYSVENQAVTDTAGSITLRGVLSGTGKLTVTGAGTLTLSGANTYSGGTVISGGTLSVDSLGWGNKGNLGTGFTQTNLVISEGGILKVTKAQTTDDQGAYGTGGAHRAFSVTSGKGTFCYSGAADSSIVANNNANQHIGIAHSSTNNGTKQTLAFDVEKNVTLTVSKVIAATTASGTDTTDGALIKEGVGTLLLSGANLYSGGTTISKGTLIATNADALGTGAVNVSGGQLSLNGDSAVELTNAINIVLTKGLYADTAAITGTGTLNGAEIVVSAADQSALETLVQQGSYKLWDSNITVSSDTEVKYSFDGLEGYTYSVEGGILTFAPIPEPSAFGLLAGVGALALVAARRRRRK